MEYKLVIKGDNGENIELSKKEGDKANITSVNFKMNTLDNSTLNRATDVRAEMVIKGTITGANRTHTLQLTKWAMDSNQASLYRTVELTVISGNNGKVLREYQLQKMFVIDYKEDFGVKDEQGHGADESGIFELLIAQKSGAPLGDVFGM